MSLSVSSIQVLATLAVIVSVLSSSVVHSQTVKQLIVITRHGSRFPLQKYGADLSETITGVLTPIGQEQMYNLGKWLQNRYNDVTTAALNLETFRPNEVRLESSDEERTLTSANSLALALFPEAARDPNLKSLIPGGVPANVPVYTRDGDNDIIIRAYNKCPTFQSKLKALYESEAWIQLENDNSAFLATLAGMDPFRRYSGDAGIVPLSEVWNVYDLVAVAKAECTESIAASCVELQHPEAKDILPDNDWLKLRSLAHEAEILKFGPTTADKLVGTNMLMEILDRMQTKKYTVNLFSAHYPTILGIFSAMGIEFSLQSVIPQYAAALIFEIMEDGFTQERSFRVVYKEGDHDDKVTEISLTHICGNPSTCPISALGDYLGDWTATKWCTECDNDTANVCLRAKLDSQGSSTSSSSDDDGKDALSHPLESGFLIGIAVGLVGVALTLVFFFCVSSKKHKEQEKSAAVEDAAVVAADTNGYLPGESSGIKAVSTDATITTTTTTTMPGEAEMTSIPGFAEEEDPEHTLD